MLIHVITSNEEENAIKLLNNFNKFSPQEQPMKIIISNMLVECNWTFG